MTVLFEDTGIQLWPWLPYIASPSLFPRNSDQAINCVAVLLFLKAVSVPFAASLASNFCGAEMQYQDTLGFFVNGLEVGYLKGVYIVFHSVSVTSHAGRPLAVMYRSTCTAVA